MGTRQDWKRQYGDLRRPFINEPHFVRTFNEHKMFASVRGHYCPLISGSSSSWKREAKSMIQFTHFERPPCCWRTWGNGGKWYFNIELNGVLNGEGLYQMFYLHRGGWVGGWVIFRREWMVIEWENLRLAWLLPYLPLRMIVCDGRYKQVHDTLPRPYGLQYGSIEDVH